MIVTLTFLNYSTIILSDVVDFGLDDDGCLIFAYDSNPNHNTSVRCDCLLGFHVDFPVD